MRWIYLGGMKRAMNHNFGGVYLLVHEGFLNRVVYVGVSEFIGRRIFQHYQGFLRGNRSAWKVTDSEDLYFLMSSVGTKNYIKYFRGLALQGKVWASTTLDLVSPKNLLMPKQDFELSWREYVEDKYVPRLGVWALNVSPFDRRRSVLIESAIQQRLVSGFWLGRFFNHKDYSVLGKIERNSKMVRIKENIGNIPELDDASKVFLSSLSDSNLPELGVKLARAQLSPIIRIRDNQRKIRLAAIAAVKERYPRHGWEWGLVDEEKLRVMLVDFEMSVAEIAKELGRKPGSVRKRIDRNDKFTAGRWRQDIKNL